MATQPPRSARVGEHTDRHGDHWRYTGTGEWARVEEPVLRFVTAEAQRRYGPFMPPLGGPHCPSCTCGEVPRGA